jgi:hypothetical protein
VLDPKLNGMTASAEGAAPHQLRRSQRARPGLLVSTVGYLMRTEVHTFAFSVAANSILSFLPFVVLLFTLTQRVVN